MVDEEKIKGYLIKFLKYYLLGVIPLLGIFVVIGLCGLWEAIYSYFCTVAGCYFLVYLMFWLEKKPRKKS